MRHVNSSRGVTPFAAVAALAALAALGSAVWLFGSGESDRIDSTRESATLILRAVQTYKSDGGEGCPTISKLREEQLLTSSARSDDAWGNRFRIQCSDDEISVSSPGPDGKLGGPDDVRVPR